MNEYKKHFCISNNNKCLFCEVHYLLLLLGLRFLYQVPIGLVMHNINEF